MLVMEHKQVLQKASWPMTNKKLKMLQSFIVLPPRIMQIAIMRGGSTINDCSIFNFLFVIGQLAFCNTCLCSITSIFRKYPIHHSVFGKRRVERYTQQTALSPAVHFRYTGNGVTRFSFSCYNAHSAPLLGTDETPIGHYCNTPRIFKIRSDPHSFIGRFCDHAANTRLSLKGRFVS